MKYLLRIKDFVSAGWAEGYFADTVCMGGICKSGKVPTPRPAEIYVRPRKSDTVIDECSTCVLREQYRLMAAIDINASAGEMFVLSCGYLGNRMSGVNVKAFHVLAEPERIVFTVYSFLPLPGPGFKLLENFECCSQRRMFSGIYACICAVKLFAEMAVIPS